MHCSNCGHDADASWEFCRNCGQPPHAEGTQPARRVGFAPATAAPNTNRESSGAPVAPAVPGTQPSEGSSVSDGRVAEPSLLARNRAVLMTVGLMVILAMLAGGVWAHVDTRNRLQTTEAALEDTQEELAATQGTLEETTNERDELIETLEATQDDLQVTEGQLRETEDVLEATEGDLEEVQAELQGVRGTLDETRQRVELQAGQIDTLQACLNGVATALEHAAWGDWFSASSALQAVSVSCEAAFEMF